MMDKFIGVPVYKSIMVSEFSTMPVKSMPLKRWHRLSRSGYRSRVNKKWLSRFGTKTERQFIFANGSIYVHPNNFDWLSEKLNGDSL